MPKAHPEPRSWCRTPDTFGDVRQPDFDPSRPQTAVDRGRFEAAKVQSRFAWEARTKTHELRLTTADVADALGINEKSLRRVYRGESHLPPAHMHALADILDIDLAVLIDRQGEDGPWQPVPRSSDLA